MALISVSDFAPSPMEQVERWIDEAKVAQVGEWDSMMVATADQAGVPSARMVLLRGYPKTGFGFTLTTPPARPPNSRLIRWRQ